MSGALRTIGRILRNLVQEFADVPLTDVPWFSLSWLGRVLLRIFIANDRDISDTFAVSVALAFLILLGVVVVGLFVWLIDDPDVTPPSSGTDGLGPAPPDRPWWE